MGVRGLEVVAEHFDPVAIQLAANAHAFLIRYTAVVHRIPESVLHQRPIRAPQPKIKPSIRPEHDGVNCVVLLALNWIQNFPCEQQFLPIRLIIAIGIGNQKNPVRG